ncbi:MAG: Rieske 2Fe-2S domain-containing protein [Proteobacteria bacterium]|nr:Rieske 2Fe-2S domain-containing protein [Pseudomonadota bacterium]
MFVPVCKQSYLYEGEMVPCMAGAKEILIVWADGGQPRAFDGICPHGTFPLSKGMFNGRTLVCPSHNWVFDARNGHGLSPTGCQIPEYAMKFEDGMVWVDTDASAVSAPCGTGGSGTD